MKKTLIIGASTKPERYAYKALLKLREHGHLVVGIGNKIGEIEGVTIQKGLIPFTNINTVTLYIGAKHQADYYNYILNTIQPKRLIFNPGTENIELMEKAIKNGIEAFEACTLVLLSTNMF